MTNGLQGWRVSLTGCYYVDMCGASGGDAPHYRKNSSEGARVNGTVYLEEGTKLVVLVGQQGKGSWNCGGGGGGSFVVFASNSTPLSIHLVLQVVEQEHRWTSMVDQDKPEKLKD